MKKLTIVTFVAAMMILMSSFASAQAGTTANGVLTVSATVNSTLKLVFVSDGSGLALSSGSGTNAATLAFGPVSALGAIPATITRTVVAGTSFTISTPVDINVTKSNVVSTNYTLTAQLGSADAVNTWKVGAVTVTNASAAAITATGAYASNVPETIAITIPDATGGGTVINNTISFTATSN
jgi:hypothetical protein